MSHISDKAVARIDAQLSSHLNFLTSSSLTTSDSRDRIESCKASIAASTTEEERAHHRANLKRNWPCEKIYSSKHVPAWDKRDLVKLY